MKFIDKEKCNELVDELQVITGKKFTDDQYSRLIEGFQKIDWLKSCQIVRDLERMERFPNNVYGVLANRIEDIFRSAHQELLKQQQWQVSDNDKASSEEFRLWFEIIEVAQNRIKAGLDNYCADNEHIWDIPPSEQKAQTWSRVVDFVIDKWIEFMDRMKIPTPKQREDFLKTILTMIKDKEPATV